MSTYEETISMIGKLNEDDLDRYVSYLLYEKKNEQAARNVIDDY